MIDQNFNGREYKMFSYLRKVFVCSCMQQAIGLSTQPLRKRKAWKLQFGNSVKGSCYCYFSKKEFDFWHAGHIVSSSNGGPDTANNLRPVCGSCNLSMGTYNMDDFKARYYP